MGKFFNYIRSSIGTKQIMAIFGLMLCAFLIVHFAGNLFLFKGQAALNGYAGFLEKIPFLVAIELVLLLIFIIHILAAAKVIVSNWSARPIGYSWAGKMEPKYWPTKLMTFTAFVILAFLVVHLVTIKFDPRCKENLYLLMVDRFSNSWYTGFYVFCMICMGIHLFHGFQSAFLTLGLDHPKYTPIIKAVGYLYAILIAAGFAFIPIYTYLNQGGMR